MRRSVWFRRGLGSTFAALLVLSLAGSDAAAQERLTATVGGQEIGIYLYRPSGPGPAPLVILSHGSPREAGRRDRVGPETMRRQAAAFVAEGAAAAVVIRRGFGGQGSWAEDYGGCQRPDYVAGGLATAEDIRAARAVLVRQPAIDADRTVLVGQSAGAWGSIAAGSRDRFTGIVAFAGGRGSQRPDEVCAEDRLVAAAAQFGRTSRAPELWIYSRNDRFFRPDLVVRLHGAFTGAGGRAELLTAEPYRDDGHRYIEAVGSWRPDVMGFLRRIGFLR